MDYNYSGVSIQTQRTQLIYELKQRKEHNEMTSLLDKPITATGDDGVYAAGTRPSCGTHARNY